MAEEDNKKDDLMKSYLDVVSKGHDNPLFYQSEFGLTNLRPSGPPANERYRSSHLGSDHRLDFSKLQLGKAGADEVLAKFAPGATLTEKQNMRGFLDMLAGSEGTLGRGRDKTGYDIQVGGGTFQGNQHPHQVIDLGGGLRSSAAGRYQFLGRTWDDLANKMALNDFSPNAQDAGALELIRQNGALNDVKAGRFEVAAHKVRGIWASLPGAGYGQHENSMNWLKQIYTKAGGSFEGETAPAIPVAAKSQPENANAAPTGDPKNQDHPKLKAQIAQTVANGAPAANDAPAPTIAAAKKAEDQVVEQKSAAVGGNNLSLANAPKYKAVGMPPA